MDFSNGEGLVAYNFEPEFSEPELNELEDERNSETAQLFTHVKDFCSCENCNDAFVWRKYVLQMQFHTIGNSEDLECITEIIQRCHSNVLWSFHPKRW